MEEKRIYKRNIWCFPLGTVGRDMVYVIVSNFLLTYIMFTRELTNTQLGAITAIMVAARIFDALNDPIMGNIIECTRSKWGKFKPWLVIGALSTSLVIAFLFNTRLQGWAFIWAFGIAYFAFSITYTMNDISYWGMIPALSRDGGARDAFTSRATLFAGIGNGLASVAIPVFTTGAMAIGGNTQTSYGIMAIIIGILSPLFLLFTVLFVKENRDDMKTTPAPVSLKKIVKTITGNDLLVWISICFLIQETGSMIIAGGMGSTYIYFTYGYRGGLYSTFTLVGMSATAFLMIFYPAIVKRLGRVKLMAWLLILSIIGYAMMLLSPGLGFWMLVIGFMCASFGQYGYYLIMMISIINTVEYNEYKFGTRDEAIIASLRPFLSKLSSALIVLITSGSYMLFGITEFTNKISSFESLASKGSISEEEKLTEIEKVLATVDPGKTSGILYIMVILSVVMMAVSFFIYKAKYKLDEAEYDRICKEIESRK